MAKRTTSSEEKVLYLRISPKLHAAIAAAAKQDERSITSFLARFLRQHFLKGESV